MLESPGKLISTKLANGDNHDDDGDDDGDDGYD